MSTIFHRLAGHPREIHERALTQMLAAVLEREPHAGKEVVRSLLERDPAWVSLPWGRLRLRVSAEQPLSQGGQPDLVVELVDPGGMVRGSIIIENKISARPTNPLGAYLSHVESRRQAGEVSYLVFVSRRWARDDPELQPYLGDARFRYVPWYRLFGALRQEAEPAGSDRWLLGEFVQYLEEMGMSKGGTFTFADVGMAALVPRLLDTMDNTFDEELREALRKLSCESRLPVKEWKNAEAYGLWVWAVREPWWVAAGYVFRDSPSRPWSQALKQEPCPLLVAAMFGTDGRGEDPEQCRVAFDAAESESGRPLDPSVWRRGADCPPGIIALAYLPVTQVLGKPAVTDHVTLCRDFLIQRLAELHPVLSRMKPGP